MAGSINRAVRHLVQHGRADDQNTAFERSGTGGRPQVLFQGVGSLSLALKKREYSKTYARLLAARAYNARMAALMSRCQATWSLIMLNDQVSSR